MSAEQFRARTRSVLWLSATVLALASLAARADDGEAARHLAEATRRALASVEPSIVTIQTVGGIQPLAGVVADRMIEERFRVADGPTTGLVLDADGLIVTASFNFAREPSVITVILHDGRRFVAKLLGRDLIRRVALLKIDARGLAEPRWLASDRCAVGQYAVACGRGLGDVRTSISLGIVSAVGRRGGMAVQTDAKTSPANYGGPLIDLEGNVIGLIVPMAGAGRELAGVEWYDSGIGFAIVGEQLRRVRPRLERGETIEPGKIGVLLAPVEPGIVGAIERMLPGAGGVRITRVAGRSPAADAGLRPEDRILAVDGRKSADVSSLQRQLSDRAAGEEVVLTILRGAGRLEVRVLLAKASEISRLEDSPGAPHSPPATTQNAGD